MYGYFVALQGMVKFRFDCQAAAGLLADLRVGHLDTPLALALGRVQSAVRRALQAGQVHTIPRVQRNADPGGQKYLVALHRKRLRQTLQDALRHVYGVFRRADVAEDQHEPVAAAARERLGLAQTTGQPLGRQLDQSVPGQMPQGVVDAFEAVQVQIKKRCHPALAAGARQGLAKPVFADAPVGQAGQQVVGGLVRQFLFHALALGDVGEQPVPIALAVAFMNVHAAAVEPCPLSILPQQPVFDVDRTVLFEKRPIGGSHLRPVLRMDAVHPKLRLTDIIGRVSA